ncbi:MAG: LemA family protein [Rhodoferax sp.]
MIDDMLPWGLLALAIFWAVGAYNRLVRLRGAVLAAFPPLDARLSQCITLLQEPAPLRFDPSRTQPLLLASSLWTGLNGACTQFDVALRVVRRQVMDPEAVAALRTAHDTLHTWWERLVQDTAYPADHLPAAWQMAWLENRRQVAEAGEVFNQAVRAHNEAIGQFPALLLARLFGFRPAGVL